MEFLIVSGLSGAGKSTVMSILEDSGFFCVDNLPPVLIPKFAEVCLAGMGSYERVAMVCDIRAGEQFDGLFEAMDTLRAMEFRYKVLFVDADTAAIIQRYKETRRSHPLLAETGSLSKAVERERAAMEPLRARADYIITTTTLPVRKLLDRVWGYDYEGNTRTVDTHIKTLRQKLGSEGHHIVTLIRSGYKFEE